MALLAAGAIAISARAESPEKWMTPARACMWLRRLYSGGIRIGLDALQRLDAEPREVTVLYYDSDKAPCACFADGIALAERSATLGARTLRLAPENAPDGAIAFMIIRNKRTGAAVRYTAPAP